MRMSVIKIVVATAALFAAIVPVRAEIRILASPGGAVGPFLELFDRVRQTGERVVIDGPCLSACTLVLMTIPEERICVTRRAVLGFHAARSIDGRGRMYAEPEASRAVQEAYPAPVRDWITRSSITWRETSSSAISSRNSRPPEGQSSSQPGVSCSAPVKAPAS